MAAVPEVTNCKLTISCPRFTNSELLYQFLTQNLGFKILGICPLVVEKDSPTESDLSRLFRELDTWPKLEQAASFHELCDSLQETDFSDQASFQRDANLDRNQDEEEELEHLRRSLEDWEIVRHKENVNHEEKKNIGLIDANSSTTLKYFPSEDNRTVATGEVKNLKDSKLNNAGGLHRKSSFDDPCREEQELSTVKAKQSEFSVQSRQEPQKAPADIEVAPSIDTDSEDSNQREDFGGPNRQLSDESKWSTNNEGNNAQLSKKRREDTVRSKTSYTSEVNVTEEIYPIGTSHSREHALQKSSFSGDGREFLSKVAMKFNDEQCTKQSEVNNKIINLVENLHQDDEALKKASSYNEDVVPLDKYFIKEKDEPHCATSTSLPINSKHDQHYYMTNPIEKPRELSADDTARSILRLGSKEQERNKKNSLYPDLEDDLQDKERMNTTDGKSAEAILSSYRKDLYGQNGSNLHETSQTSSYEENNDSVKLRGCESAARINTVSSVGRETNPLFESQPVSRPGEHRGSSHDYLVTSSDPRLMPSSEGREMSVKEQDTDTPSSYVSSFGRDTSSDSQPISRPGQYPGSSNGYQATSRDPKLTSSSDRGMSGKEHETSSPSNIVSSFGRGASRESQPVPSSGQYPGSSFGCQATLKDPKLTSSSEIRRMSGKEHETSSPRNIVSSLSRDVSHEKEPVPSSGQYQGSSYDCQATLKDPKPTSSSEIRGMSGKEQETSSPSNIVSSLGRGASRESQPVSRPGGYPGSSYGCQATSVDPRSSFLGARGTTGYIASSDNSSYIFRGINGLQVHVLKASIINLNVDCIVNAANRRLKHADGIAKIIAQAAGYKLEKECEDYTKYGGTVGVTDLFVTTGGLLRARYVLHAVGPKWNDYTDKNMCEEALRHTILRCLVEAGRLGCRSIAIPSISAAKAKVPKELCAKCYIEAAKMYDKFQEVFKSPLQNIYFVDISDSMVDIISSCCQIKWYEPIPDYLISKDWAFVDYHLQAAQRKEEEAKNKHSIMNKLLTLNPFSSPDLNYPSSGQMINVSSRTSGKPSYSTVASRGAPEQSPSGAAVTAKSQKSSTTNQKNKTTSFRTAKKSAIEVNYEVENITFTVSSRRAFDHQPYLTLTVGSLFDELSSLANFKVSGNVKQNESRPTMKNHFKFFDITKPGGNKSLLVCRLFPEPESTEKIKEAFKRLEQFNKTIFTSTSQAKKLVITSCFLYKDSDKKLLSTFAQCLLNCLKLLTKLSFKNIIVTGSEDTLSVLMKVLENGNLKRIKPEGDDSNEYYLPRSVHKGEREEGQTRQETKSRLVVKETEDLGTSVDSDNVCQICTIKPPSKQTPCCQQKLCGGCEAKLATCPWCKQHWKIQLGDQPEGFMTVSVTSEDAAGYDMCGSYKIEYFIPRGTQQKHHPTPGARFDSLNRTAYIPMTKQGFQVLLLLRLAFIRKLTFTIGQSMTTSRIDTLTWNDIHHKTALRGSAHSYPDTGYLDRVTQELFSKGVTIDSATDEESKDLDNFSNCVQGKDRFSDLDKE